MDGFLPEDVMVSSQAVLALTVTCAFTFGLIVVLLSSMRGQLATHLKLPPARVDSLWAAMNCSLVPLAFVAGVAIDVGDVRWVIVVGSLLAALGFLLLQAGGGFRQAMLATLLAGAGGAAIAVSAIVLMPRAFFGSSPSREVSASLNLGNAFFVLGALVAPVLADVLLRSVGVRRALGLLAVACLVPGVLALLVHNRDVPPPMGTDLLGLLTDPVVWLAGAVFFLYAPLEGCLHNWAKAYLAGIGHSEREGTRLVAWFWGFFLMGRMLTAFLQHMRWLPLEAERWIVFIMILGATVCLGNLVGVSQRKGATTGFLMLGLFLGPIFPTLLAFLFSRKIDYVSGLGTSFGMVFAIGSAGSLVFAPLVSGQVDRSSAQKALRIPLVLGFLLLVLSLVFALWQTDMPR